MRFSSLEALLGHAAIANAKGPVAAIIAEDGVEVATTIAHHDEIGFRTILLFAPDELDIPSEIEALTLRVTFPTLAEGATTSIVNAITAALPEKTWFYYCYNAEYIFYPFSEHRNVGEMLNFHAEDTVG